MIPLPPPILMKVITICITTLHQCYCCCCSPIQEEGEECVHSCLCLEKNWTSFKDERELLQAVEGDLKVKVNLEEMVLYEPAEEVELWLKRCGALAEKGTNLEREYGKLKKCLCNCTPNVCRRVKLGRKVSEELQVAKRLISDRAKLDSLFHKKRPSTVEVRPCQLTDFGMEQQLSSLRAYFENNEKRIIGIHGLGGVGKTTLLNKFNNELMEGSDYHVVIFIEVSNSQVLNVAGMQMEITRRLGLSWNDGEQEAVRANRLLGFLRKRKFVIILDDVREAFKLQVVGIPDPSEAEPCCKLIIASHSKDVCIQMEAHNNTIEVECLNSDVAWRMFQSYLGEEAKTAIESDGLIKKDAEAIVDMCGGLPLAIKIIGTAVAQLKDRNEWSDTEYKMKMTSSHLQGMDVLFRRLQHSYDQLEPNVQMCFLYCALFPDYGSIKKSQLTNYWIGEDLVDETWEGNDIIHVLISASLLEKESDDSQVKMHNVIRQFARWLTNGKNLSSCMFLVQAGHGFKEAPRARKWERARRISLMSNDIVKFPRSPECNGLSTLLLQNNPNLKQLHPDFFIGMPSLKVLDLSYTAIEELPIRAGTLTGLQHLNLCNTRISRLPEELANLKELRHLDLSKTPALKVIPDGTISVLTKLRVLNIYRSLYEIRGEEDLNLERLENLEFLGITIHSEKVLEKLQTEDLLAASTCSLSLQDCPGMKSIKVSVFEHMAHLKVLYVHDCSELKHLDLDVDDMREECSLKVLTLAYLPNFEGTPIGQEPHHHHHLRNLCDLTV